MLWITWSTRERLEVCIAPKKTQSVQCIVEHGTNGRAPKSIQSARNTQDYYAMLGVLMQRRGAPWSAQDVRSAKE